MLRELKTFITVARLGTFAAAGQQVGLTQSAGTARIVADLATGAVPPIGLAPFSPARFGKWT